MSDIKLFRPTAGKATELQGDASDLEMPLQTLIEANLEPLLGICFLATVCSTGKTHAGRIDSLGLDESNCPVILEFKRSVGENVINQGLFDPAQVVPLPANGRDISQQAHWGAGDLEPALTSQAELDAARPLILMAYEGRSVIVASKSTPTSAS